MRTRDCIIIFSIINQEFPELEFYFMDLERYNFYLDMLDQLEETKLDPYSSLRTKICEDFYRVLNVNEIYRISITADQNQRFDDPPYYIDFSRTNRVNYFPIFKTKEDL